MRSKKTPPTYVVIAILCLTLLPGPAEAQEVLVLGEQDEWTRMASLDGVGRVLGVRSSTDLVLRDAGPRIDETVDLYLSFDGPSLEGLRGNYHVRQAERVQTAHSQLARLGDGAAYFHPTSRGITLEALPSAMLAPGSSWGSFSISFWLKPSLVMDGEIVFRRRGTGDARLPSFRPGRDAEIRAEIVDGRLSWVLDGIFSSTARSLDVRLTGRSRLVPNTWTHHSLQFDAEVGLLEYLVDGVPEDLTHTSPTGREMPTIYYPSLGPLSDPFVEIAPSFVGLIDEFEIISADRGVYRPGYYSPDPGVALTEVFDLGMPLSRLVGVEVDARRPGNSELVVSYRISPRRFGPRTAGPEWIYLVDDELPADGEEAELRGRFVQFRFALYPDGSLTQTPRIASLRLNYEPNLAPVPPARVAATPYDGAVRIDWSRVPEADVRGYYLYFGTSSARYAGFAGMDSPIDVGDTTSITLHGLENGVLYYFAVSAYDEAPERADLVLSQEVHARPLGLYDAPP